MQTIVPNLRPLTGENIFPSKTSISKLLVFELKDLPVLQKGGGVQLQKIKDNNSLYDLQVFNLEDGISPKDKIKARKSFVKVSKKLNLKNTGLWTRVNAINSKWFLDDISYIIENLANKLDVIMLPMINTPEEILFADRIIALNEAKYKLKKQIKIHVILEMFKVLENRRERLYVGCQVLT